MAYFSKKKLKDQALAMCKRVGVTCITDVINGMDCGKSTFYERFPNGSSDLDEIKDALEKNKCRTKMTIRQKLYKSDSPTAWLSLYRMIATQEERDAISLNRTDITTNGKPLRSDPIVVQVIDSREQVENEDSGEETNDNAV